MADATVTGNPELTPPFGRLIYEVTVARLAATDSAGIWASPGAPASMPGLER